MQSVSSLPIAYPRYGQQAVPQYVYQYPPTQQRNIYASSPSRRSPQQSARRLYHPLASSSSSRTTPSSNTYNVQPPHSVGRSSNLNRLLGTRRDRRPPLIYHFLLDDTRTIRYEHDERMTKVPPALMDAMACDPPVPSLRITCTGLPWSIIVKPRAGQYVTVRDVLEAVHYDLVHRPISQEDYSAMSPEARAVAKEARRLRCAQALDQRKEEARGLLRVDGLGGRVVFGGLALAPGHSDAFVLESTAVPQ